MGLVNGILEKEGAADNGAVMHNLAAALFAQGLWETAYLVEYMGGHLSSVYTLPGSGDLYVTCQGGRNSRMGRYIGLGMNYQEAKAKFMPDDTVEGAELLLEIAPTLRHLVAQNELDGKRLPLLLHLSDVICHNNPVHIPWDAFFHGVPETLSA